MTRHRALLLTLSLAATPAFAERYIVLGPHQDRLPSGLRAGLEARGATVRHELSSIGALVVDAPSADFAQGLAGVRSVVRDRAFTTPEPQVIESSVDEASTVSYADQHFGAQWGFRAVNAGEAHAAGLTGRGVRVAVLDSGINWDHPDLVANVNRTLSKSFVDGEAITPPTSAPRAGLAHGTWVAGIIGAAANNASGTFRGGMVGIAPRAEIVAVKVLSHGVGYPGTTSQLLAGLEYAASIDAKVVNLSLSMRARRSGACNEDGSECLTARELAEIWTALARATQRLHQKGAVIVAAAGNDGLDADHERDIMLLPAMLPHVITASGTQPEGYAHVPGANLDAPYVWSNVGQRLVTLAAPAGITVPQSQWDPGCLHNVGGITRNCMVYRGVIGPNYNAADINRSYLFTDGTSGAAPHVAGIAALIIEAAGGNITPAQVEARLREWADDVGEPGRDAIYGHGRVNARAAIQQ